MRRPPPVVLASLGNPEFRVESRHRAGAFGVPTLAGKVKGRLAATGASAVKVGAGPEEHLGAPDTPVCAGAEQWSSAVGVAALKRCTSADQQPNGLGVLA
mmetsp:Transcript_51347/g.116770  ORF Transcript_51347/g.116770 Transcript_51347/m.116770 type:complete len:100 (+) Transcript_51347:407-706(+)